MSIIEGRPARLLSKQGITPYLFHYGGFKIVVHKDVFPPDLSSSSLPLFDVIRQYEPRLALDMGCGTGILSLQLSRVSHSVFAVDNHPLAIENAKQNIAINEVNNVIVARSDLFAGISLKYSFDLIVFNHPYYPSLKNKNFGIDKSGGASLIRRFLLDSIRYLASGGRIVMPFSEFAGRPNDPLPISARMGFQGSVIWSALDSLGCHCVYELRYPSKSSIRLR